jgi:hypothetical protein
VDDAESMDEAALLKGIRVALLRDLFRALSQGTATHQEKAIAKALLRDNNSKVDATEEDDDDPEETSTLTTPARRARTFGDSKG